MKASILFKAMDRVQKVAKVAISKHCRDGFGFIARSSGVAAWHCDLDWQTTSHIESSEELPQVYCDEGLASLCKWLKHLGDLEVYASANDEVLTFSSENGFTLRILISKGNREYDAAIRGCDADLHIPAKVLQDVARYVVPCVDHDSVRFQLARVLFDFEGHAIVATDGRRMAVMSMQDCNLAGENGSCMVNSDLIKAVASFKIDVRVWKHEQRHTIIGNGFEVLCRNYDGRYPAWRMVMPDVQDCHYIDFSDAAFDLCKSANAGKSKKVMEEESATLGLLNVGNQLHYVVHNTDDDMVHKCGDMLVYFDDVLIDSKYLAVIAGRGCSCYVKDAASPVMFESGSLRYVVMPLGQNKGCGVIKAMRRKVGCGVLEHAAA